MDTAKQRKRVRNDESSGSEEDGEEKSDAEEAPRAESTPVQPSADDASGQKTKGKKRGRPPGSKNKKQKASAPVEGLPTARQLFEDDQDQDNSADMTRSGLRALESTPRVGLRDNGLPVLEGLPLPWFMQKHVLDQDAKMNMASRNAVHDETGRLPNMPADGPFNDTATWRHMSSRREQLLLAKSFAAPLYEEWCPELCVDDFKDAETDEAEAAATFLSARDATSAVLFAATRLHQDTRLDWSRTPQVAHTVVRQMGPNHTSTYELQGVHGGPVGCKKHVFFWLTMEDGLMETPPVMLAFASILATVLQPSTAVQVGVDLHPCVQTAFTDLAVRTRTHVLSAVRTQNPYNLQVAQAHRASGVVDEINETLLNNVLAYRNRESEGEGLTAEECVPPARHTNDSYCAGRAMPASAEMPVDTLHETLFQISVGVAVYRAVGEDMRLRKVKLNTITVDELAPGVDFCVALKQVMEIASIRTALQPALLTVLRHMFLQIKGSALFKMADILSGEFTNHHLASVLAEDNVMLAMLNFGAVEKLRVIDFGGALLRPLDPRQSTLLSRHVQHVYRARFHAFRQLAQIIQLQDQNSLAFSKDKKMPLRDFRLDGAVSWHWRSVPKDVMKTCIQEHKDALRETRMGREDVYDDSWESDFDRTWNKFYDEQLQDETEEGCMYFAVNGALHTKGLELVLNINMFNVETAGSWSSNAKIAKNLRQMKFPTLPQPRMIVDVVRLYLSNAGLQSDPFNVFWQGEEESSEIYAVDAHFLQHCARLPGSLYEMRESMLPVNGEDMSRMQLLSVDSEQILELLGKNRHPLLGRLQRMKKTVRLSEQAGVLRSTFRHALAEVLETMRTGELLQWEWAARMVLDLKQQGVAHGKAYVWQKRMAWQRGQQASDDGAHVAMWLEEHRRDADLRLAWAPHMIIECLDTAILAIFGMTSNSSAYGQIIKIVNCGQGVRVLAMSRDSHASFARNERVEIMYDRKDSSCGADMCHAKEVELNMVYNLFCVDDENIVQFYNSEDAKEVSAKHITAGKAGTWLGCGMKREGDGSMTQSDGRKQAGCAGALTEASKMAAQSATQQGFAANLETAMDHSGTTRFIKEVGMETHMDGKPVSTHRVMPFPGKMYCSNRPDLNEPPSLYMGGRYRIANAPVRDGARGVLVLHMPVIVHSGEIGFVREADAVNHVTPSFVPLRAQTAEKASGGQVGELSRAKVQAQRDKALYDALKRRAVCFVQRSLALGYIDMPYTLSCNFDDLMISLGHVTRGMRRFYLRDAETWQRTFSGPLWPSTIYPKFMEETVARCLLFHMSRARQSVDAALSYEENQKFSGQHGVGLYEAYEDMMMTFVQTPITLTSMLSGMYLWLAMTVLDATVMILSCYMFSQLGFGSPCPLIVLAKAANDIELDNTELQKYMQFCDFIAPLVLDGGVCAEPFGPKIVPATALRPVDDDELQKWLNPAADHIGMYTTYSVRTEQNQSQAPDTSSSTYVRPGARFVSTKTPAWVETTQDMAPGAGGMGGGARGRGRPGKLPSETDEYVTASPRLKLAQLFAEQQGENAATQRQHQHHAAGFQHTGNFWNVVRDGTRLPRWNKASKDTKFDMKFDDPELTGHFFETTLETLGGCDGPMTTFLTACGCGVHTSRKVFFEKLLRQYALKRGLGALKVRSNAAWRKPILHQVEGVTVSRQPAFEWAAWPNFEQINGMQQRQGVEVALCVDVMYLVVGQMFCEEWKAPSKHQRSVVVHLRNLGYAASTLLTLMIHTSVELSMLPLKEVVLQVPCPRAFVGGKAGGEAVRIGVEAALHADHTVFRDDVQAKESRLARNVLVHNRRRPHGFKRISVGVEADADGVFYRSLSDSISMKAWRDLFPFPPEGVSHMQTHFLKLREWKIAYDIQFPERTGNLVTDFGAIIYEVGKSISSGTLGTIPLTITHGVADEIPCMTFNGIYLFVLRRRDTRYEVVPVTPSFSGTGYDGFSVPTGALPIKDNKVVRLDTHELQLAMLDGFWYDPNDACVLAKEHEWWKMTSYRKLQRLPFMPFPVINWDHLVLLDVSMRVIESGTGERYRMVNAQEHYDAFELTMVSSDSPHVQTLADGGVDVQTLWAKNMTVELLILGSEDETVMTSIWITLPDGSRHFFCNIAHLRAVLQASPDEDLLQSREVLSRVHGNWLVANSFIDDIASLQSFYMYPILSTHTDDGEQLVVEMTEYGDDDFQRARQQYRGLLVRHTSQTRALEGYQAVVEKLKHANTHPSYTERRDEADQAVADIMKTMEQTSINLKTVAATMKATPSNKLSSQTIVLAKDNTAENLRLMPMPQPPPANGTAETLKECVLGLIKGNAEGTYISDGNYTVQVAIPTDDTVVEVMEQMDFLSVSRCLVPECASLCMALTQHTYRLLRSADPCLRLPDMQGHRALETDNTIAFSDLDHFDEEAPVWLRVRYILGSTLATSTFPATTAAVRVLVLIKSPRDDQDRYDFTDSPKLDHLILYVSLLDPAAQGAFLLVPEACMPDASRVVPFLYRDKAHMLPTHSHAKLDPGKTIMWKAHDAE